MKIKVFSIFHRFRRLNIGFQFLMVVLIAGLVWFFLALPDPLFRSPASYVIEDAEGELLGATIADDGQWRFPFNEKVPDKFAKCIIRFEDKRFRYHPGVDPFSIFRAAWLNTRSAKTVSGGSTLTMQVIRLARNKPRNIFQKIIESILAVRLELTHSKNTILALYASNAPFGGNVVGLDAAAWRYYGRSADKLSWGEMAALAVLPNAPALVHPGKNRALFISKRNRLLDQLHKENLIDSSTCLLAKMEPLPDEPLPLPQYAPHLLQRFRKELPQAGHTRVRTTIRSRLQKTILQIVEQHHRDLKGNGINNACALVIEVQSGNTLAYVGNVWHPEIPGLQSSVDMITARRSPGSTLKPLLYAAMLSDGRLLPNTLIPDIPTQIGGYSPQNFDNDYNGAVPASLALSRSLNVPAVRMLRDYKYPRFYDLLKTVGITTLNKPSDHYGLSLILGGCEVTPWDLAGVYAGLARSLIYHSKNKGRVFSKDFYPRHYLQSPEVPDKKSSSTLNFLDPVSIEYMFQSMEEVMRPGEEGLWKQFSSAQRVAWKTGTSFGFRDAWAVGVTPRFVIVVWTGNASGEGRPGLIGVQTAAPIMFDILRNLPASSWFETPNDGVLPVAVCRQSGCRANTDCSDIDTLKASPNGDRAPQCPYHTRIHLNRDEQYRVTEDCVSPSAMVHKSWFVLPPTMAWYYKRKHFDYQPLPPFLPGCGSREQKSLMAMVYPAPNAKIYVPKEISGQRGKAIFTATHQEPDTKIFWHLDNTYIGTTLHSHQMALDPSPGEHLITIVDETGERITNRFKVLDKEE